VTSADVEGLVAAYDAAGEGDVDALATLFTPTTVWRGIERGHLWWRRAPS
jgi:ketosteroid isomerase-like protein